LMVVYLNSTLHTTIQGTNLNMFERHVWSA
jgi:hypothetical protein